LAQDEREMAGRRAEQLLAYSGYSFHSEPV